MEIPQIPRANILGVQVSAINMQMALNEISRWVDRHEQHYVCVTPAHGVMECQRNPELLDIFNHSGLTTPDGMAIVWLLKTKGFSQVSRVYGPDLLQETCKHSIERGYRHFFYGGKPGVAELLIESLTSKYPGLHVAGWKCPPFRELSFQENEEVISEINAAEPDIVWVGISTPKQERWMARNLGKIHAPVMVGVGAAFDFLSGVKPQAPKIIQRSGLEWLFRLATEPRRLWPRYAEYPKFVWLATREIWAEKNKK